MRAVALLIAVAACGDDQSAIDGGSGDDALIDADPNVRGPVSVKLVDRNGAALPGMHVVFVDTDGTVTDLVSDASGSAGADVFPNASVTAIREREGGVAYQLTTVLALNPGDSITLIAAPGAAASTEDTFTQGYVPLPAWYLASATKQGSIATYTTLAAHGLATGDTVVVDDMSDINYDGTRTVTGAPSATTFTADLGSNGGLPAATGGTAAKADRFMVSYAAYGGAATYEIYSPCGRTLAAASTSAQILLRAGCSIAVMDLVVVARSSGGAMLAWTSAADVTVSANGSTTIGAAWQTPVPISATYSNPGPHISDIGLSRYAPYVREPSVGANGTAPATLMVNASAPAQAAMQSRLTCVAGGSTACVSPTAVQTITQTVDGTAPTYALDIEPNLLPWVTATWTPTTTTMDMSITGTGAYDLFHASLRYTRGQVSQIIYTWRIFGPIAGTFQFPTLPSTVPGDPTIRVNDPQAAYVVNICDSDAVNGYRDAIKNPYAALGTCTASSSPSVVRYGGTSNRLSSSK